MSFCNECGKKLKEGEICNCKNENKRMSIIVIIGSIMMILGCLLPFYKVSFLGYSVSTALAEGADGKIVIALAIVIIFFAIIKLRKLSIIIAVINLCIAIYYVSGVNEEFYGIVDIATGAYAVIIGAVIVIVGSVLGWRLSVAKTSLPEMYGNFGEKVSAAYRSIANNAQKLRDESKQNKSMIANLVHSSSEEITCPNCGTLCKKGSSFCIQCGCKLEKINKIFCPQCGQEILKDEKFCGVCGRKIDINDK